MTQQYLRKVSLLIGTDGAALDLSGLRFVFDIRRGDNQTPNSAKIRVFNISRNTAQQIRDEFSRVILQAGYENGPYGTIFDGQIKQVQRGRASQTETYMEITAASGDQWYNWAVANTTLAAGSTAADRIAVVAKTMDQHGISQGYVPEFESRPLPRGRVMFGMARDLLRCTADNVGADWSIQDTTFQMVPQNAPLPREALVLNAGTGMIGMPTKTQNGISVKILLNPNARISALVKLDNKDIEYGAVVRKDAASKRPDPASPSRLNDAGVYKIMLAEHAGDTEGQDWYTTLTCIDVDLSTAPAFVEDKSVAGPGQVKPKG